jgi:GH15 family glucan-1,4-alpha-glucosidase
MPDAPALSPVRPVDGYLRLEDVALIGDGATAALVGRDGSIPWLCVPRLDAPPLYCGILDAARGGAVVVAPEGLREAGQRYEPDTAVVVTDMRGSEGLVRVTDCLALRPGTDLGREVPAARGELVRRARVLGGRVRLRVDLTPRGRAGLERAEGGWRLVAGARPDLGLSVTCSAPLDGLVTTLELGEGEVLELILRWGAGRDRPGADDLLEETRAAWLRWIRCVDDRGPAPALVRRSAITLKLLDHLGSGAIAAAPTSSLPESIGGPRNWDYRYAWVRDAAYAVYAARRVGLVAESRAFLSWVLAAIARSDRPRVLYDLDGHLPPAERIDEGLEGYRASAPVRFGNAAVDQHQHDVYGEILDCAWQWASHGGAIDERLWSRLRPLVEEAATAWRTPDHGIWEVRTSGHPFTYSAAMCQVALDRGARLSERLGLPGDPARWRREAEAVARAVREQAWDPAAGSLTEHLGGGGLDASLLALPLRRVLAFDDPRMVGTVAAVERRLGAGNGLLFRYLPDESPDGIEGHEGAFLLCSFWMADNLAGQGRLDEAHDLFESLCARAGPLGLLPEQIDPADGGFLGNHPQAFSHVGLVSTSINLRRREAAARGGA